MRGTRASVLKAIYGDHGNDHLDGGDGNDVLYGGEGNDRLRGQRGDDVLAGGPGNDGLSGDSGDEHGEGGSRDRCRVESASGCEVGTDAGPHGGRGRP